MGSSRVQFLHQHKQLVPAHLPVLVLVNRIKDCAHLLPAKLLLSSQLPLEGVAQVVHLLLVHVPRVITVVLFEQGDHCASDLLVCYWHLLVILSQLLCYLSSIYAVKYAVNLSLFTQLITGLIYTFIVSLFTQLITHLFGINYTFI